MRGRLVRSSLQTGVMLGLRVATQAVVLVLLTRLLGPYVYGNFAAVASLAVILGLLPSLGAGFVMLARGTHDETGIADVWRYAWPMTVVLGLLLLLVYVVAASAITRPSFSVLILLTLGAAELLLTPFTMMLSFALQARERVPLSQFVQWLPLGLRMLALAPCFWLPDSLRLQGYVSLQFIASLAGFVLGLRISQRHVRLDWRPRWATRREIFQGASFAAMHLVAANPSELDKVIATRAVGADDAGIYAATSRVMSATVMPVIAMLLAAQPRLFRHAHEPTQQGHRLIVLVAVLALAWGSLSGIVLALLSPLLPVLFGASFAATSQLMPWLAAAAPFLSLRLAAGVTLVAQGHPAQRIVFEVSGILVLVAGILVFAPFFGTRGIAIALVAAEFCMASVGWWLVHRQLRSSLAWPQQSLP